MVDLTPQQQARVEAGIGIPWDFVEFQRRLTAADAPLRAIITEMLASDENLVVFYGGELEALVMPEKPL